MSENNDKQKFTMECPECGSEDIKTEIITHMFEYNTGQDIKELECEMPARICLNCGEEYIDSEAEEIMHETVCRYEGVMTPDEIRELRESHELSQSEFANVTGLGVATVSRWERGTVIQNEAYDKYLSLLKLPLNFERLLRTIKIEETDDKIIDGRKDGALDLGRRGLLRYYPAGCPGF